MDPNQGVGVGAGARAWTQGALSWESESGVEREKVAGRGFSGRGPPA